jgi:hypothetical protein
MRLRNAARYFNTCADASCTNSPLINSAVIGYNYDMAQGVTYDIDLTRRSETHPQPDGFRASRSRQIRSCASP